MASRRNYLAALIFMMSLLAGCQAGGSPSETVEDYLQAIVDGDWTRAVNLSCAAWEDGARTEANSFESIEAWLEGVTCTSDGTGGDVQGITCEGVIMATYGAEDRQLTLEGRVYNVVLEDAEWRMCGYR